MQHKYINVCHISVLLTDVWLSFAGETCIHVAAMAGDKEILQHLTWYGADVNAKVSNIFHSLCSKPIGYCVHAIRFMPITDQMTFVHLQRASAWRYASALLIFHVNGQKRVISDLIIVIDLKSRNAKQLGLEKTNNTPKEYYATFTSSYMTPSSTTSFLQLEWKIGKGKRTLNMKRVKCAPRYDVLAVLNSLLKEIQADRIEANIFVL